MAHPSPSSLLILSIKWLNWKPWGPDFAFQWFLITLIWFLNVEGNCIEISTSIYSCVHSNTLISKPNIDWRLVVYHLLWPALGGSLNGCVNYQTHWCWLRAAKMPLHHSSGCEHFLWGNVKCRAGPLGDTLTECTFYTNVIPSHHMIMTIPCTNHKFKKSSAKFWMFMKQEAQGTMYSQHYFPCIHLHNNF